MAKKIYVISKIFVLHVITLTVITKYHKFSPDDYLDYSTNLRDITFFEKRCYRTNHYQGKVSAVKSMKNLLSGISLVTQTR